MSEWFDRAMAMVLRVTAVMGAAMGIYHGFHEDYAHAAFLVSWGAFNLLLAREP